MTSLCALALACSSQSVDVAPGAHGVCRVGTYEATFHPIGPPTIALLFVVDDSIGMAEAQAALGAQMPRLFEALRTGRFHYTDQSTGEDVLVRFDTANEVRVGVVTADMGSHTTDTPGCTERGDDGLLRASVDAPGCTASLPNVLHFRPDSDTEGTAHDAACSISQGTSGCGFQAPLEAALYASATYSSGRAGHGDLENAEMFGDDPVPVFVVLSNDDDCSTLDPSLFDESSPRYSGDLATRCARYPDALTRAQRYVDELTPNRNPERGVFSVIAGIPPELADGPSWRYSAARRIDFDGMLADPRMQRVFDSASPTGVRASCTSPTLGAAYPPRHLVEVAKALEERNTQVVLSSLCEPDPTLWVTRLLLALRNQLGWPLGCMYAGDNFDPDPHGLVPCGVTWTLAPDGSVAHCSDLGALVSATLPTEGGGEVCLVNQLAPTAQERAEGRSPDPNTPYADGAPRAPGWFFDDFTRLGLLACQNAHAITGQVRYTPGVMPPEGAHESYRCEERTDLTAPVDGDATGEPCVSTDADGGVRHRCRNGWVSPGQLFCREGLCQRRCLDDSHCLGGQLCQQHTGGYDGIFFCVDPLCTAQVQRGAPVGHGCHPLRRPEETGWRVGLELGSAECAGGPCLVDGSPCTSLQSAERDGCDLAFSDLACPDSCLPEPQLAQRIYCTCRCDAPEGTTTRTCRCPHGFSCQPIIPVGGERTRGSYCQRDP